MSEVEQKVKVYNNQNIGLGGAINLGIKNSSYKYTIIVMADLSDSPEDIFKYYKEIILVDCLPCSRTIPISRTRRTRSASWGMSQPGIQLRSVSFK